MLCKHLKCLMMKYNYNVEILLIHWIRIELKCKNKEYCVQMHFFWSHTVIVVWKLPLAFLSNKEYTTSSVEYPCLIVHKEIACQSIHTKAWLDLLYGVTWMEYCWYGVTFVTQSINQSYRPAISAITENLHWCIKVKRRVALIHVKYFMSNQHYEKKRLVIFCWLSVLLNVRGIVSVDTDTRALGLRANLMLINWIKFWFGGIKLVKKQLNML